jgi:hypothetical protein
LQAWSLRLDEIDRARAAAQSGVTLAREGLAELKRLTEAHRNAVETVRALLGDAAAISLRPTTTASPALLENWCDAIDNSLRGRDWHAVNVGLSRFSPVLAEAITAERQLLAAAAASCAEVDDLQGRFQALKAKERALRARASLPERCAALRARLDAALAQRPLVLPELRSALSSYQALLAAGGRPSSPRS